ncbi:MAG TPA: hypothetical protein PKD78_10955, partial [Saprospiraceae bacterium]|nr:hypothetical protein [Saprospiraceae bacterium]
MTHPTGKLPNEQYLNGLRHADLDTLIHIYTEFRAPIMRVVSSLGGSEADGAIFFRAAVVEAGRQARAGELPAESPIFYQLRELAVAHFRDWQQEREEQSSAMSPPPEPPSAAEEATPMPVWESLSAPSSQEEEEPADPSFSPSPPKGADAAVPVVPPVETLRHTRRSIYAWRHFERLDGRQQSDVLGAAQYGTDSSSLQHYLSSMNLSMSAGTLMPTWMGQALLDREGYAFWKKTQDLERRISNREPLSGAPKAGSQKWGLWIMGLLGLWLVGSWAYERLSRDAAPQEVYQEHFQPPASILDDLRKRQAADTMSLEPLPERPGACEDMLSQADANYREKDYRAAATVLYRLAEDESLSACHADAWFYLGVVALQMEEPDLTLQCFAKIDNLDR